MLRGLWNNKKSRVFLIVGLSVIGIVLLGYFYLKPAVLSQKSINSLQDVTLPQNGQTLLFFSPHPDDETVAAAGYLTQSIREGANVIIVLVTNGNKHHNETIRYNEFKTAMGILGVPESNLVFLNLPDGTLEEMDKNRLSGILKEQIDKFNPEIILYPHPDDTNPDHMAVGKALTGLIRSVSDKRTAYEYLVHYKLFYPQPRKFDPSLNLLPPRNLLKTGQKWERFMLPQDIEDLKILAIFNYKSQLHNLELRDLMLTYIRQNELFAVPQ